jgi:ABC-2 type transport system ATP-binding protein
VPPGVVFALLGEVERVADIVAIVHAGRLLVAERLDVLKQTTRQLTITVAESTTPLPPLDGQSIYQRRRGRQWDVLVRSIEEPTIEALRFAAGVVAVEARTPSLEEIFVSYMTGAPQPAAHAMPSDSLAIAYH